MVCGGKCGMCREVWCVEERCGVWRGGVVCGGEVWCVEGEVGCVERRRRDMKDVYSVRIRCVL